MKTEEIEGDGRFDLHLFDAEAEGHQQLGFKAVQLDRDDPQWEILRNLPDAWTELGAQAGWVEAEAELIGDLGVWVSENVLGEIAESLVANAPATVWIERKPDVPTWLLEAPLAIATLRDPHTGRNIPLADRRVIFSVESGPPTAPPPPPHKRLRVLAAFSSPTNESQLSLRQERYRLAVLARKLIERNSKDLDLNVLQYGATAGSLRKALEDGEGWDIVHLSGHGTAGVLMLENDAGQAEPVDTDLLLEWLESAKPRLKLVTLMACSSAATVVRPWFEAMGVDTASDEEHVDRKVEQSLASRIADQVGCTVVAMRYPVRDRFCIEFAEWLYGRMWEGNHSAVSAVAMALRDSSQRQPTDLCPSRSTYTPAVFGNVPTAAAPLAPPNRTGPQPPLNPKMSEFFLNEPQVFVGRVGVLAAANRALASGSGKSGVILHGAAGMGKSHCALELAYGRQDDFGSLHLFSFYTNDRDQVKPDFDFVANRLVRALNVTTTDRTDNFAQWLDQITEAIERRGALLVFDQVDLLLTSSGAWKDPIWSQLFGALCNHRGEGRIVITSRVPLPDLDGAEAVEVKNLSPKETIHLVQQLPGLSSLLDGSVNGRPTLREIVSVSRGNPQLLTNAESVIDNPDALHAMVRNAREIWTATEVDPDGFLREVH